MCYNSACDVEQISVTEVMVCEGRQREQRLLGCQDLVQHYSFHLIAL